VAALLLAVVSVPAGAAVPVPPARPMYFEHLTTRDGLSQGTVQSMLQDSQGYLWLGTESGLDRYDGYSVREYRRERGIEHALANDYIWGIAEDADGDLWLATDGGGVERWDRKTDRFEQFRHSTTDPESLASDATRAILIDAAGRVWIATQGSGVDVLDPHSGSVRHYRHNDRDATSLAADAVFALYADRIGRIWVGTDAGLCRYEASSDRFVTVASGPGAAGLSDPHVRSIREDHAGTIWIGTNGGGLNRFEPDSGRVTVYRHDPKDAHSISHDRVRALLEDAAHRLWVATADGLDLFDRDTGSFVRYGNDAENPQSLRASYVMSLYQDRGGVLWVGTRGGGASHWNPRSWSLGHYRTAAFRDTQVNAFADNGAGTVWVGTAGSGLVEIDIGHGLETNLRSTGPGRTHLTDDRVMALLHDDGVLWIGTMAGGLDRLDLSSGTVRAFRFSPADPASLPADGVMTLYKDRLGTLWVGTFGGGLASIDRTTGVITRYPHNDDHGRSLSSGRASAIVEDTLGNLWIGTAGGGLNLLDRKSGKVHVYRRSDRDATSLNDDTVYALHVDHQGQVWVGTAGGGLDRVIGTSADPEHVRFENQAGLARMPSQVVWGIESDRSDGLWLSTNNGLVRFDPRTRAVKVFHEAQGLQGEEFDFTAHYQAADGALYFGGNNGFNAFSPDVATPSAPPPRVVLTAGAKLDHPLAQAELLDHRRPLELAYDDKLLTLDFAALDFTAPANNRYAYRLDGFDAGWIDAGPLHRATYTNLDAGDYVFRARAANADGVWSESVLEVPVHVAPAPWKTRGAIAIYVLIALVALGYAWRGQRRRRARELRYSRELERTVQQRTHELEERNAELLVLSRAKSDFVARMSHELRTPMNGVLGMTSLLLDTRLEAPQRRFAEAIHLSADSVLAIVDDVLDFSKIEAGRLQLDPVDCDLVELIEQTAEMLAVRAATKDLELVCDLPSSPLPRVLADAVRLRQVLVNLGGNAVKFTEHGEVTLRVTTRPSDAGSVRVRIDVADTGMGIAPENQTRIFEEFAQEDASTTRRFGGTGLGLPIARQIVELMGGTLELTSAPGAGSTFSFELAFGVANASSRPATIPGSLDGRRVLLVDRASPTRAVIERALGDWRATTVTATSLAEATACLHRGRFDAIVVADRLSDGMASSLLEHVDFNAAPRPLLVRLQSFVNTVPGTAAGARAFDAELTRPVRLAQLNRVLSGAAPAEQPVIDIGATARRRALPLLGGSVLVVEDQPLNREVAIGMLAALGIEAETANDGHEALAHLARRRFDVVLMDCQMPVMDGYSATIALRRREGSGAHTPVIALTADATAGGRAACAAAGMDDYLAKPFNREALHAILSKWMQPGRATATATTTERLLDAATLDGLRALPPRGERDMLSHIGELYLVDSTRLVASIEECLRTDDAAGLARAAHAWRSYNGNVGAHALAALCRELEERARERDVEGARGVFARIGALHERVREELASEMRRSA
jgi:signal transduction histidine kinase/ligand-binding sensor domain-containing protein/CheY-like chemotaxis protein/HPt (histidine-containing phosphotransfer) domain-containing protein